MFAVRQLWRLASTNFAQKSQLVTANSLVHFTRNQYSCGNTLLSSTRALLQSTSLFNNKPGLLQNNNLGIQINQERSVTKFSRSKGKRRTVKNVLKRFYRLDWGIWIRTRCGRHKKMYKKSSALKRRLKEHVFCNAHQSQLLDKMVTPFWKQPKYFVDDPYEPYHKREEFPWTRKFPVVKQR